MGHVAGDALTARTVFGVMGVLGNGPFETSRIPLGVTCKTESIAFCDEVGFVLIAMDLVAVEATKLAMVHVALHEVIPLHPVLVCGQVGVLSLLRRVCAKSILAPFSKPDCHKQELQRVIAKCKEFAG